MTETMLLEQSTSMLQIPLSENRMFLERMVRQRLDTLGLEVRSEQLTLAIQITLILLPDIPLERLVPFAIQTLWIYLIDPAIDSEAPLLELEKRLKAWRVTGETVASSTDIDHQMLKLLCDEVATQVDPAAYNQWWAAMNSFLDAQITQRNLAMSYLTYLSTRLTVQGGPLTIVLAAALYGCLDLLQTARSAQLMWWLGCYTVLNNDTITFERERREGTADTGNAYGVLQSLAYQNGTRLDINTASQLVHLDMHAAKEQVQQLLGPRTTWNQIDTLIARMAYLVAEGHAH